MTTTEKLATILSAHIREASIPYCVQLWEKTPFHFQVKGSRKTKLGDFRYRRDRNTQLITINADLNPYQFLLTYIHEVAHLHTFTSYGTQIRPHGKEWKSIFQQLMLPLLSEKHLPIDLLIPLRKHMISPKASSSRDLFLMKEMSKYDQKTINLGHIFLSDLKQGCQFDLSGRIFEKGETRRTRVLCTEVSTGKKFLIAQLAKVKPNL